MYIHKSKGTDSASSVRARPIASETPDKCVARWLSVVGLDPLCRCVRCEIYVQRAFACVGVRKFTSGGQRGAVRIDQGQGRGCLY